MPASKPKIKAVIFDLGGVIMSGGYLPFVRHYLKSLSPQGKKQIQRLEHEVNLGKITEDEFYRQIQETFQVHLTPKQMHASIVRGMRPNKQLLRFIPKIRRAKVVLFSNSIGHMATEVLHKRHIPMKKVFDRAFMSEKIHLAKPDKKAYEYVINHLNIRPEEALMVDDRAENIRGVKKIGMQGIVFKNTAQFIKALKQYELV